MENLTEDERKALRGSKFAPLPAPPSSSRPQPRLAHPGGPLATNKAAALAKFLERKLQEPGGLSSLDPALLERAVQNAKETVTASTSSSGRAIRHVASFGDPKLRDSDNEVGGKNQNGVIGNKPKQHKKKNKNKNKNKNKVDLVEEVMALHQIQMLGGSNVFNQALMLAKCAAYKFRFLPKQEEICVACAQPWSWGEISIKFLQSTAGGSSH